MKKGWLALSGVLVASGCGKGDESAQHETLARLRSSNQHVRQAAARELALSGVRADAIALDLSEDLRATDVAKRRHVAQTLGAMESSAQAALPALVTSTRDPDPIVRMWAAVALGRIGSGEAQGVPALIRLVESDPAVAGHAVTALGRFGVAAEPAVPVLVEHLGRERDEATAQALGRIGPVAQAAVPGLIELLSLADVGEEVRQAAAWALGRIAFDGPLVRDALQRADSEGVRAAREALASVAARGPR